jgi:hypothetical protein
MQSRMSWAPHTINATTHNLQEESGTVYLTSVSLHADDVLAVQAACQAA